jgi:uncharacterized protein
MIPPFHLALPVHNLETSYQFYIEILGCTTGRSAKHWLDINFWGHQVSLHLCEKQEAIGTNSVDHDEVPVRHFGVILPWKDWHKLKEDLLNGEYSTEVIWVIEPKIRFRGEIGEQATMFIKDPSGNVLEFKSFQEEGFIFQST